MKRNITYNLFGFDKTAFAIPQVAHYILSFADAFPNHKIQRATLSFPKQFGVLSALFEGLDPLDHVRKPQAFSIFICIILFSMQLFSQGIQTPKEPTFNLPQNVGGSTTNTQYNTNTNLNYNTTIIETNTTFKTSYRAPQQNQNQNNQTKQILDLYNETSSKNANNAKKQLWELKLRYFKFVNHHSELYKKLQPFYEAAFDSINQMLTGTTSLDLKRAVFLIENVFYENKLKYSDFCKRIEEQVSIINQILKRENLSKGNNVALNYAIQQLYLKPVKYIDKTGVLKTHPKFQYDFNDPMGAHNYSNQFVTKFLATGKGQCHSMPLLYLILANEIGANANLAYSPNHSYIAFPDNDDNYYNFECTSGGFTSYSFIMSSGYVKKEAIKSGIYTVPTSLKETIANQLNDLATQQLIKFQGVDDYQLKCAKRTLEFFPNNIMALQTISNYQTAKTEAATCYTGWPNPKDISNIPELKKEFDDRDKLYDYVDNLGYSQMTDEEYNQWLNSFELSKSKQESEEIKNTILLKAKIKY